MSIIESKARIYCGPCRHYLHYFDGECLQYAIKEYDTPIQHEVEYGKAKKKNRNNDCADFETRRLR